MISAPSVPQANAAIMSTLAVHYQWNDHIAREKNGRG